jgi:hypothetical protein
MSNGKLAGTDNPFCPEGPAGVPPVYVASRTGKERGELVVVYENIERAKRSEAAGS